MSNGNKYDSGKTMAGLMFNDFSRALSAVAEVSTYGCKKYGSPSGWQNVPDAIRRYGDAKSRHLLAGATSDCDEESGSLHKAHEAWNALAVLELFIISKRETKTLEQVLEETGDVH